MRRALLLATCLCPGVALAVPPLYLPDDVAGARSIAMGDAFRAIGSSNDAIVENPAAMVQGAHYEIDGFFAWDTQSPAAYWNGSIVDATTLPMALGLSYTHIGAGTGLGVDADATGRYVGASYRLALAYPVSDMVGIGVNVNWLMYNGDVGIGGRGLDAVTGSAALALKLTDQLSISAIGYNLVPTGAATILAPLRVALGAAYGTDSTFRVDVDGVLNIQQSNAFDLHVGGEYFIGGLVAARLGYFRSGLTQTNFGSAGVGLVVPGFGLDIAYRNSVLPWNDQLFLVDIKFFLDS